MSISTWQASKMNENQMITGSADQDVTRNAISRRALLRAGWVIPAIAVTPLMNTASAMSTVSCDNLLAKRDVHRKNGDRQAYDDLTEKLLASGCPC